MKNMTHDGKIAAIRKQRGFHRLSDWAALPLAVLLVIATLLLRRGLQFVLGDEPLLLLFVLPIMVGAWCGGWRAGLLATVLAALLADYFLLEPRGEFGIASTIDRVRWAELWIVGIAVSLLMESLHRQHRRLERSQEASRRLASIVESSSDAIIGNTLDGTIVDWNAAAERMYGCSAAEAVGRSIFMLAPPDQDDEMPAIMKRIERGEPIASLETERRRRDGSLVSVALSVSPVLAEDGSVIGASTIARDITAQKKAEEEMARLASFPMLNPNPIVEVDLDGRICFANPGAQCLFPDLLPMQSSHPWLAGWSVLADACHRRVAIPDREVTVGERLYHQTMHYVPEFDRLRIYGMDITDRQQAEERLRQIADELKRSNSDLEQFAYVASHDLQEPLRMVTGFVQLLHRQYAGRLDADADKYIDFAVDGAKRMQTLINDLLAYARIGMRGRPATTTSAEAAFRQALANLCAGIEETAAEIARGELPEVRADDAQLVQLFQNLIGNALKFHGQAPPKIRVEARRQDDEWLFSVTDNGIGIAPEFRDRIFLIFQRLHGRGEYAGTGIGLAICKRIVDRHGGRIWVESQAGQGATFYFTLPT
jgi:PAS domain S-box-containing protein